MTMFNPVILAKERSTSLMSASLSSREIGSPVKRRSWLSTSRADTLSVPLTGGACSAIARGVEVHGESAAGAAATVTGAPDGTGGETSDGACGAAGGAASACAWAVTTGAAGAGLGSAGAGAWGTTGSGFATATTAGASPPTRSTAPRAVGSNRYGKGWSRSTTTRTTGVGAVANCATRTRWIPAAATAWTRRSTRLITPGRSRTTRGGESRVKTLPSSRPAPPSMTETPPLSATASSSESSPERGASAAWAAAPMRTSSPAGRAATVALDEPSSSTRRRARRRPASSTVVIVA